MATPGSDAVCGYNALRLTARDCNSLAGRGSETGPFRCDDHASPINPLRCQARRPESFFEAVYRDLYATHRKKLLSDSRSGGRFKWMEKLQIIDSTTITLFSNIIFKGAGRNPKTGKKKGGIKVHKVIRALEGFASDIKFTSAATHDSFMLAPENFDRGDLLAIDRAYIDYGKFEELTKRGVVYVTKMKSGLSHEVVSDLMFMDKTKGMTMRVQNVIFTKKEKNGETIIHHARIVTAVELLQFGHDGTYYTHVLRELL